MNKIYRFTIFKSDSYGNGADKRTAQISEILEMSNFKWTFIPTGFNNRTFSIYYVKKYLQTTINFFKIIFIVKKSFNPRALYRTLSFVTQFKGVFSIPESTENYFVLWEAAKLEYSFILPFFKKRGYKVIGIPHNLESLVSTQKSALSNKMAPYWLMDEIKVLKECEIVFAISREETLLLRQCGIRAEYLPYYPTKEITDRLLTVRNKRIKREFKHKSRKKILIIGSAVNPPTKLGMIDRLTFFKRNDNNICDILIAGYGTEDLKLIADEVPYIKFLGELSNEELFSLLFTIDAILIHQPPTSGALTRIVESLIAGVPVLANFNSARNYFNTNGVNIYYSDEELIDMLKSDLELPQIPPYPVNEIKRFSGYLSVKPQVN